MPRIGSDLVALKKACSITSGKNAGAGRLRPSLSCQPKHLRSQLMVRQADRSPRGLGLVRAQDAGRTTRTGAFALLRWDYVVFTPMITNTCPKRRIFSESVTALAASRPRQAFLRTRRSSSVLCRAAPPVPSDLMTRGQNAKHSMRLPIPGTPSRGGAGGPVALPPAASLLGPPGVDSSNR